MFRDPGQILKIRDYPGDSGTVGAYEGWRPLTDLRTSSIATMMGDRVLSSVHDTMGTTTN